MAIKITASEAAQKLIRRLQAATPDIQRGVERVTEAPGVAAAAAQDRMLASIIDAIQSGRWAAAVSGVSLTDWKRSMIEKGIPRIASGVAASEGKITAFFQKLLPALESVQAEVRAMPNATLEDRINRANHQMRRMNELKGTFK